MFDFQQPIGQLGHGLRVAVVGLQQLQRLLFRCITCQAMPEQRLEARPTEKIRVHDLVAVTAQDELPGLFQQSQDQGQLHRRQVLHFVDDDKVVNRLAAFSDLAAPSVGNQVAVVLASFIQPGAIALKQAMCQLALRHIEQALTGAQRKVVSQGQGATGQRADDAAEFFEQSLRVQLTQQPQCLTMALTPARKGRQRDLAPLRNLERFQQFAIAQKLDRLLVIFEAVRGVKRACTLRQVGRQGDIKHLTLGFTQTRQRDCGFA